MIVRSGVTGSYVTKRDVELRFNNQRVAYYQNILQIFGISAIAYWPLWDESGTTAQELIAGRNGTYNNVTLAQPGIGDGRKAPTFGAASYIRAYSAGLNAALNNAELTVMLWAKLDLAAWTDGAYHFAFRLGADDNNAIFIQRIPANNYLRFEYNAGGTLKYTDFLAPSYTGWMHLAITASKSADKLHAYLNGSRLNSAPVTGLGTWAGALSNTYCGIGSRFGTAGSLTWLGSLAHVLVLNRAATPLEIAQTAAGTSAPRGILFVGDSKTATEWQYLLFDQLNIAPFAQWAQVPVKIGISGATTLEMKGRCDADIAAITYAPQEILINLGANDVNGAILAANWKANTEYIIQAYHAAFPGANIRLTKIWKRNCADAITLANTAIDELYAAYSWLKPGINESFLEGGDDGTTYTTDGTHYSAAGAVLVANAWKAVIV